MPVTYYDDLDFGLVDDGGGAPEVAPTFCPYRDCDGDVFVYLGTLGRLTYWRCRDCGGDFPRNVR